MDTKLKSNKYGSKLLFIIMVISLGLALLHFQRSSIDKYGSFDGEFYESLIFTDYITSKVNAMYDEVDEEYHDNDEQIAILSADKNIRFMAINNKTNKIYTNTEYNMMSDFKNKEKGYVEISGRNYAFDTKINNKDFKYVERTKEKSNEGTYKSGFKEVTSVTMELKEETIGVDKDISVYAVLPEIPKEDGQLKEHYLTHTSINNMKRNILIVANIGIIIFLISIFITKVKGYGDINEENKMYKIYSNIAIELKLAIISTLFIIDNRMDLYYFKKTEYGMKFSMEPIVFISNIIIKVIYITMIYMLIKNIKDKSILKTSIIAKAFKLSRDKLRSILVASRKIGLIKRIILIFLITIVVNISIFGIILLGGVWFVDAALVVIVTEAISFISFTTYIILKLSYLNEIMEGVKQIESGDINYKINIKGNDSFTVLAENINGIGNGLDNAIEERMRSEKMKSELITNVSHDLKTPLTSILNYVDLLMKEDVKPEHLNDYIKILDKKSKRLKILIEDLFEAAKATSGSVELNIEKIQLNQLLTQSIAEMEGKIKEANLDMKFNFPENKVYINADGKKLFRVFENLISNIVKYSLKGTRVYVDMNYDDEYAYINFKNISAYELNFDEGEIIERFKRGDISRSEEGSGLGLSIAKGLVELQGGEFIIQTDGDLFKAIVKLELSKE